MRQAPELRTALAAAIVALAASGPDAAWSDGDAERAPGTPVRSEGAPGADFGPRAEPQQWSIGEPTADEQELLELMNRARLDPVGEGDRLFDDYGSNRVRQAVDFFLAQRPGVEWTRAENRAAFQGYPARPPLAFNGKLIAAARGHSQVLKQNDAQSHQEPGEKDLRGRITDAGYGGGNLGESVFSFAESMLHAHAGFAIDYGQSVRQGESRPSLGHRLNLMDFDDADRRDFREVGIGVIDDASATNQVGPHVVTIDFAKPSAEPSVFVTGVCYDDANHSGAYEAGEGLAGVRIELDVGSSFAISSASGGYAVPVSAAAGNVRVTATGAPGTPGETVVGTQTVTVEVNGASVKQDFGRPPDPPLPAFAEFASAAPAALADEAASESAIEVTLVPGESAAVGDLDVEVAIHHPERSELRITLVSPANVEVLLFDRAPGGAGLAGRFDSSLTPRGNLGAFVGGAYAGTWTLRVEDTVAGNTGTLTAWELRIRPQWARTLNSPASPLFVTTLKWKDAAKPARDAFTLNAQVDTEGVPLDPTVPCNVRLRTTDVSHGLIAQFAVPATAIRYAVNGTSRTLVSLRLAGLDLPSLPPAVEVELAIGGAIVRSELALTRGAFAAASSLPAGHVFHVDSLASHTSRGGTRYTVKGRLGSAGPLLGAGVLEVSLGDFRFGDRMTSMHAAGAKRVFTSGLGLRKLTIVPATGKFAMVIETAADVRPGNTTPLSIRLGDDGFFGATEIVPEETGTFLTY